MTQAIGRNDPCPCGSGKKYKQCCGNTGVKLVEPDPKSHDGAVERAMNWLTNKHRKAVRVAVDEMLFDGLSEEEQALLEDQDPQTWQGIQLNAMEWLLAEGQIRVKGELKRVSDLLLGQGGPLFSVGQRRWIAQLTEQPLRLYTVTQVMAGSQMTVCDALDGEAMPIVVREKSGSQASLVGTQVGYRIMRVENHYELSGAAYPFSRLAGAAAIAVLREASDQLRERREDLPAILSYLIRRRWLAQYFAPMPMPTVMDAYSGEPILLITDHYQVKDWHNLAQSLSTQRDVQGDRESGWDRLLDCPEGQSRAAATINIGKRADRISLFYRTQRYADQGRPWFEALGEKTVRFISREVSDPKALLATRSARRKARPASETLDLPPEVAADVIEKTLHRLYANWTNEPIEALGGKTPLQAKNTSAGLERVKGLLRSYEASEASQAQEQGRRAISYGFLWDALRLAR